MKQDNDLEQLKAIHAGLKERATLLYLIPNEIEEKKRWVTLKKAEEFFIDTLPVHFSIEEDYVFPDILAKNPTERIRMTIEKLTREHAIFVEMIAELEKAISGQIFPLTQEARENINIIIESFNQPLCEHARIEDNEVFPLYKG